MASPCKRMYILLFRITMQCKGCTLKHNTLKCTHFKPLRKTDYAILDTNFGYEGVRTIVTVRYQTGSVEIRELYIIELQTIYTYII